MSSTFNLKRVLFLQVHKLLENMSILHSDIVHMIYPYYFENNILNVLKCIITW